jgi:ribosomal protein L27
MAMAMSQKAYASGEFILRKSGTTIHKGQNVPVSANLNFFSSILPILMLGFGCKMCWMRYGL